MENPLLQPFDVIPFSRIKTEHFKPAFESAISKANIYIRVTKMQVNILEYKEIDCLVAFFDVRRLNHSFF